MSPKEDVHDKIIDNAEQCLRQFGPEKTRVVDVAKACGFSHAYVYQFFSSRADLLEAVTERWLVRIENSLDEVVQSDKPAEQKMYDLFQELHRLKKSKLADDPYLYETFEDVAKTSADTVDRHINIIQSQVTSILNQGADEGTLHFDNAEKVMQLFWNATLSFHHPILVSEHMDQDRTAILDQIIRQLLQSYKSTE
ncbi:TetR/AcrR family transcriptional regulator [Aliifodinibius sp. S!AR15-10]|uniref:TetR/AcrR family transcriptional regulator n=1 Tax=Aliifodinibius sp. S!AR15-10 TaxID=2950437 RepID=UPI00285FD586|nr:TetR family transcriptional regulator [Aliifodinibius sp. S!AR15-10]MDR8393766.1 TetR/AcrR family transcriptional regulator [Aliifodinibius sp. S!AR15-10]